MGDKDTVAYRIGGLKEMQMLANELRITLCMFVVVARVVFVPQVVQVVIAKQKNRRVRVLLLEADDILQIVVFRGVRLKIVSIVRIEVISKEDVDHIGVHKLAPSVATMNVANEIVGHVIGYRLKAIGYRQGLRSEEAGREMLTDIVLGDGKEPIGPFAARYEFEHCLLQHTL